MAKKRGNRRKGKKQRPQRYPVSSGGVGFVQAVSPSAGSSPIERAALAPSVAEEAGRRFDDDFSALQADLLRYEPLSLLAHLSFYFLTVESDTGPPPPHSPRIMQHHVELLQSLVLRHDVASLAWMPMFPDFVGFLQRLDRACHAFYVRRMTPQDNPEHQERLLMQEQMRSHTQAVRNWGYPDQMWRIVVELFAPLDDRIEAKNGVRVAHLVGMCQRLLAVAGGRIHTHFERLQPVARAKTVPTAIDAHQRAFQNPNSTVEESEQFFAALWPDLTLDHLKESLVGHLNLRLADVYTFGLDDFVAAYSAPVDREKLEVVIAGWSLSFGDLKDRSAEGFFLDNPVWTRPFVRLDDGRYFCPIPGLLQSFCLELMEGLLQKDPDLLRRYQDQRGDYLEAEVERLFTEAFPSARVFRGSRWRRPEEPAIEYENDLLVMVGSHLIVVEAKAGAVTDPALRGSPDRLKREIRKLLVEPSEQARRFANFLRHHPSLHRFPTKRGAFNEVDAGSTRETVCLTVTLDQLGRIYSRWPALRDAGLVKPGAELVPTLALVDLESVFEVLDGQCQRLHYLVRRGELERTAAYVGGELDLLALYLDTGFNIGQFEFDSSPLMLIGDAAKLNPYLMRRATGANPPRPRLRLTPWWRDIARRVEETQPSRWTDLGVVLLSIAYDEQERFEKRFKVTRQIVEEFWRNPGHEDVLYFGTGPEQRRGVVAGFAVRQSPPRDLPDLVDGVADRAMEVVSAQCGVVIVVDVLQPHYPYRAIAFIEKHHR